MADAPKKLAAGGKPYKSKPLSNSKKGPKSVVPKLDEKLSLKISKIAKRKKKNKTGVTALSYTVIPKGKRLAGKVVEKLERDQYHFVLARALEAARKLNKNQTEKVEEAEDDEDEETDEEEADKFKVATKNAPEYTKWKQNKIRRIAKREKKRRKRREFKIKEELRRKQHRIHPGDLYHMYLEGYERKRHRITKKRFMRCVDINLLQAVMEKNQELMNSPLWDDDLDIHNLSYVRARILKDHLQQFEVLEEALKQGIFNIHGCDELPILNIRRRRRPKRSTKIISDSKVTAESEAKRKLKSDDKKKTVSQPSKRRLTYPPFKEWKDDDDKRRANGGWLSKVTSWIATKSIADGESKAQRSTVPQPDAENTEEHLLEEKDMVENEMDALLREEIQDAETKGKEKCISNLDVTETGKNKSIVEVSVEIEPETNLERETSLKPKDKPFSDFLTIKVPLRLGEKKKFIYNLVKRRISEL
ncbi:unnamed protein product [Orchesella dallaii]|uniref:Uncharacterized protein n=1 Tax=Orchesella dallaii TaxID=48710 RepID=A0ABP1RG46_9HEXA